MGASYHYRPVLSSDRGRVTTPLVPRQGASLRLNESEEALLTGLIAGQIHEAEPDADTPAEVSIPPRGKITKKLPSLLPAVIEQTIVIDQQQAEDDLPPAPLSKRRKAPRLFLVVCAALLVLGLSFALSPILAWLTPASATILLTPASVPLSDSQVVSLAQIGGHQLAPIHLSESQAIPTTGTGHYPAIAARGQIILFNASPSPVTLEAGTQIGGKVVIDNTVTIPGAILPTDGQISVPGHALEAGPGGNIAMHALYGTAITASVFADNGAFSGGQAARKFQAVAQGDINKASSALKAMLTLKAASAYHLADGEALALPVSCTPKTSSNYPAGGEADQVTVIVSVICRGVTYSIASAQHLVHLVPQVGYDLVGQPTITVSLSGKQMQLKAQGLQRPRWSADQLTQFAQLVAGKSKIEALEILSQQSGVSNVLLQLSKGDLLPADPTRIYIH